MPSCHTTFLRTEKRSAFFLKVLLKHDSQNIQLASDILRDNKELAMEAVAQDGDELH